MEHVGHRTEIDFILQLERETDLFDPMLVPERLAYPSSIRGYILSRLSSPFIDFTVLVELVRRVNSGRSSIIFLPAKPPPYKLDPGATDDIDTPHPLPSWALPHCHAISGPLFASSTSARCRGGGRGGGTGSLAFGIDIGPDEVEGEDVVLYELDLLQFRYRFEGFESFTNISGRAKAGLEPR